MKAKEAECSQRFSFIFREINQDVAFCFIDNRFVSARYVNFVEQKKKPYSLPVAFINRYYSYKAQYIVILQKTCSFSVVSLTVYWKNTN